MKKSILLYINTLRFKMIIKVKFITALIITLPLNKAVMGQIFKVIKSKLNNKSNTWRNKRNQEKANEKAVEELLAEKQ